MGFNCWSAHGSANATLYGEYSGKAPKYHNHFVAPSPPHPPLMMKLINITYPYCDVGVEFPDADLVFMIDELPEEL